MKSEQEFSMSQVLLQLLYGCYGVIGLGGEYETKQDQGGQCMMEPGQRLRHYSLFQERY